MVPDRKHSLSQHYLTFTVLLFSAIAAVHFYFYISPSVQPSSVAEELSLEGPWNLCIAEPSEIDQCHWSSIHVPSDIPLSLSIQFNGWLIYKKKFTAPKLCLSSNASCALFFGEIGDAAEVSLNNIAIGQHGALPPTALYAKHYPGRFELSRDLLKSGENANELKVVVYSMKKVQAGIRRGPVGIFQRRASLKIAQSFVSMTVFTPILGFSGLFLVALIAAFFCFYQRSEDKRIHAYIRFCVANSIFLLSFSEVPREYLPIWVAGYLHFTLRLLSDWAYFEMIREFYDFGRWASKYVRPFYALSIVSFVIPFFKQLLTAETANTGAGFDLAYTICRIALPLLLLPHILGMIGAFRERRTLSGVLTFIFFSNMLMLQIHDSLIFHGLISGTYAVKIYPLFIGLAFGWVLLKKQQKEREKLIIDQQNAIHATQVAHDIRSPLAALNLLMSDLRQIPEEHRLVLRHAVTRIQDIANSLIENHQKNLQCEPRHLNNKKYQENEKNKTQFITSLLESLITEKRIQYRNKLGIEIEARLDSDCYGLFSNIQPKKFKRVLSNLINNSVEALSAPGRVEIATYTVGEWIEICVHDNGQGIPKEILPQLTNRGVTFGKPFGSGLGLYSARQEIESCGGTIKIESVVGQGTCITLRLPKAGSPKWFVPRIELKPSTVIVLLDDDSSIHQIWQRRFASRHFKDQNISMIHLSSPVAFRHWFTSNLNIRNRLLFLTDYEFMGQRENGIELIESLHLESCALLITSHYENARICEKVENIGIGMIPKGMAGFVPIHLTPCVKFPDAVLLDDEELIHISWKLAAQQRLLNLYTYDNIEAFLEFS